MIITCPHCQVTIRTDLTGRVRCKGCGGLIQMPRTANERLNHKLHIGLCLLTLGAWIPVYGWLLIVDSRR